MNEVEITLKQAKSLVEWFGGDEDLVLTLVEGDETFHSGKGLYACDDYAEHGFYFLGDGSQEEDISWSDMFMVLDQMGK